MLCHCAEEFSISFLISLDFCLNLLTLIKIDLLTYINVTKIYVENSQNYV